MTVTGQSIGTPPAPRFSRFFMGLAGLIAGAPFISPHISPTPATPCDVTYGWQRWWRCPLSLVSGFIFFMLAASIFANFAHARPRTGPVDLCYNMLVLKVVDGDTVYGYIDTSDPVVAVRVKLRLIGIDAPERKSRAKCDAEAKKGEEARRYLSSILSRAISGRTRMLARACGIKRGKYSSRRLGRLEVRLRNGWVDMNKLLLAKGYAIPYSGGRRGQTWCNCLQKGDCPAGYLDRQTRSVRGVGKRG